jgi:predicted enzyme involved in methoxymalonyl-ACP biosynthesis
MIFKYFQKQILKQYAKGILLTCSKEKFDRKWLVQRILKFSNFVLFWRKMAKTSKFAHFQAVSILVLKLHVFPQK